MTVDYYDLSAHINPARYGYAEDLDTARLNTLIQETCLGYGFVFA